MPHGDFSDIAAVATLGFGLTHMISPGLLLQEIGPFAAAYVAKQTPEVETLIRILGWVHVLVLLSATHAQNPCLFICNTHA